MMDQIKKDCLDLIDRIFSGRIAIMDYIAEMEILEHKYPAIGFQLEADRLRKWVEEGAKDGAKV